MMLVRRAAFLELHLRAIEVEALDNGKFDRKSYTQAVNSLLGCLRSLGLYARMRRIKFAYAPEDEYEEDE